MLRVRPGVPVPEGAVPVVRRGEVQDSHAQIFYRYQELFFMEQTHGVLADRPVLQGKDRKDHGVRNTER